MKSCALIAALACVAADLDGPSSANLLVSKIIATDEIVQNTNVTLKLTVFNTGSSSAYKVSLKDSAAWAADQWQLVEGSFDVTWDTLKAGANVSTEFVVAPKFSGDFQSSSAAVSYVDGELDQKLGEVKYSDERVTVTSNRGPKLNVLSTYQKHMKSALKVGRVLSLNLIRTEWGWMVCLVLIVAVSVYIGVVGLMDKVKESRRSKTRAAVLKELEGN